MKKVLSIAGSDCSGGAGIQADLLTAVELAVLGGCTMVQLRKKDSTSLNFYSMAKEIKRQFKGSNGQHGF